MKHIKQLLHDREAFLLKLKKEKETSLETAPEGSLRICRQRNKALYFLRDNPKDFNGKYIREQDLPLAQQLAQKTYDVSVLRAINQELRAIQKYFSAIPKISAENVYETLSKDRQHLITPIEDTDEEYIKRWSAVEYQGKEFDEHLPELFTSKGERVRSKSEIIIADSLARESIPYRYESPLRLAGYGKIHPDFTVLNVRLRKELYWEHLGMMDEPTYVEKAVQKIVSYEQNGIFPGENLILTFETRQNPINQKLVTLMIQRYLK